MKTKIVTKMKKIIKIFVTYVTVSSAYYSIFTASSTAAHQIEVENEPPSIPVSYGPYQYTNEYYSNSPYVNHFFET